jgi:PAS domain S-box-containing protein
LDKIAFSQRIGTKIFATLIVIALFTILVTGLTLITLSSTTLRANISQRNLQIARRAANDIDLYIDNSLEELKAVAEILDPLTDPWIQDILLENLSVTFNRFKMIFLVNKEGEIIASSSINHSDKIHLDSTLSDAFEAARQAKLYLSPVKLSEERLPFMIVSRPVGFIGKTAQILIAELDLRHIWELVDDIAFGGSGEALLLSNQGLLIAHPDKTKVLTTSELIELPAEVLKPAQEEEVFVFATPGTERVLVATASVHSADWTVLVRQPLAEAYLSVDEVLIRSTFLLVAVLAVAVLASVFLARHFSSPLNLLLAGTLRIGQGDLDYRIDLPNKDEIGRLSVSFNNMVGELKDWSAKLKESEERYRQITESVQDIIFSLDKKGRLLFINKRAKVVSGYDLQDLQDHQCMEFLSEKSRKEIGDLLRQDFIRIMHKGLELEVELITCIGQTRILEVKLVQVFDSAPRLQFFGVARDITQRKEAERKLLSYQHQLRSLASQLSLAEARERKRIAADLHDRIGQALALTQIKLNSVKNRALSTGQVKGLTDTMKLIDQTIREVRSLIFDLSSPLLYEVGLKAALEQLVEHFHDEHKIMVALDDDALPKPLDSDGSVLVFQAVKELLVNAVKHASARHIRVTMRRSSETVEIAVHDDGVGFDVSKTDFKPGRKGGFGLFNIRERLEYMGGSLQVESKPGKGTRACLVLGLNHDKIDSDC